MEAQALNWIREHPPYVCDATNLREGMKVSMKYANKLLERLHGKGQLIRTATGRYQLTERPLAAFLPPGAVAVGGIVHRGVVADVGGPRVNGLQMNLRLGALGADLWRRIKEKST